MQVQKESVVSIHYTLKVESGETVQNSLNQEPVIYLHGHGNLVSGLEEALEGTSVGAKVEVTVPPEKGYGEYSIDLVKSAPRSAFPAVENIEIGMAFLAETEAGQRQFVVTAVNGDEVEVNGNHPLAGETLTYSVSVEGIRDSTVTEREQGYVKVESSCQKTGCCD